MNIKNAIVTSSKETVRGRRKCRVFKKKKISLNLDAIISTLLIRSVRSQLVAYKDTFQLINLIISVM